MDAIQTLDCLAEKNIITEAKANELKQILATFRSPGTPELVAALLLDQSNNNNFEGAPLAANEVTSANTTDNKGLTIPDGATKARITVSGNNIIYTLNGVNPVGTVGHLATVGSTILLSVDSLALFRFHSAVAGNAVIYTSFYP